ncbi:MAG TPA: (2Fe-2S)-binding protein [Bacilli bacterium]|nr:MAG: Hydrogen cyanide synthase subunit HcnA [Tenericutes bacterium ADurb.BinA124]HPX84141.1 (2Fe-2S)-binding protein [Bacilli bacterium]
MRIKQHPILDFPEKPLIAFTFNGQVVYGHDGDTIASALQALNIKKLSASIHLQRPRGFYCAIGNCSSCQMIVDGVPNVKTCITLLKPGMIVQTQTNRGELHD